VHGKGRELWNSRPPVVYQYNPTGPFPKGILRRPNMTNKNLSFVRAVLPTESAGFVRVKNGCQLASM